MFEHKAEVASGQVGSAPGLLDCSRRLEISLNTVKRYPRAPEPDRLRRPPQYRPTLVDPYRDHLRRRRTDDPGVPVLRLLDEIKTLGYTGGLNLSPSAAKPPSNPPTASESSTGTPMNPPSTGSTASNACA